MAHNMQNFEIVVVKDNSVLDQIAAIHSPVSEAFIHENRALASFYEVELRQNKVGILDNMFPSSWRTLGVNPYLEENREVRSSLGPARPCGAA